MRKENETMSPTYNKKWYDKWINEEREWNYVSRHGFYTISKTSCEINNIKFKYEIVVFALE